MTAFSSDVSAGSDGTATQFNNLRKDVLLGGNNIGTETDGATVTIDLSDTTKGKIRSVTIDGNRTLAISNATVGQVFALEIIQGTGGSKTVTWWAGITWNRRITPTLTPTEGYKDVFGFRVTGSGTYDGFVIGKGL